VTDSAEFIVHSYSVIGIELELSSLRLPDNQPRWHKAGKLQRDGKERSPTGFIPGTYHCNFSALRRLGLHHLDKDEFQGDESINTTILFALSRLGLCTR
jgi:hypothetical protein